MSRMESHIGKIRRMERFSGEELEDQCKRILFELYEVEEIPDFYNNCKEYIVDNYDFLVVNDQLFEILDDMDIEDDFFKVTDNGDGTYNYAGTFYNGSTSLTECIEEGLLRIM